MIPIRDENPTRTVPFVNYLLIAANIAAFVWEWLLIQRDGSNAIIAGYGLVATRLVADPLGEAFTVLSSMFMHGGLEHLGGNLLFLYIFGDNVEDSLGHGRYVLFYLVCGVIAAAAQMLTGGLDSPIAMVGASGAISGVLGAYMVLYPRAPILMLNTIPLLWLFWGLFFSAPAWLVIGYWFLVSNLMPAVASLGIENVGGVALFAHIGGFLGGLLLIRPLVKKRPQRETFEWAGWRPPPRRPHRSGRPSRSRYENWRDGAS